MALFIVSREIRLHVEAPDAQTAQAIAYDVLAPSDFDVHEAEDHELSYHASKERPWARDDRGGVRLSPRTCGEIVTSAALERERLEQEQEAAQ